MARVTVEDCLDHVENRFELVLKASDRARKLMSGAAESTLEWGNDKPTVLALREIASGLFSKAPEQGSGDVESSSAEGSITE